MSLFAHSVRSSTCWSAEFPSSKATSVKSSEWYSSRLTGQERRVPFRTRHRRMFSRPHDTILEAAQRSSHSLSSKLLYSRPRSFLVLQLQPPHPLCAKNTTVTMYQNLFINTVVVKTEFVNCIIHVCTLLPGSVSTRDQTDLQRADFKN